MLAQKKFQQILLEVKLGSTNIWSKKKFGWKKLKTDVKKNGSKIILGSKKFESWKL